MAWPRDDAKLERVRALMAEEGLDALVVRAPDNVLYLTNFWGMKGYDACVFPREGEPVLICLEASAEDAERRRGRSDVRLVRGYAPTIRGRRSRARSTRRSRRARELRARRARALARHAGLRPDGRRADDLHEGVVRRVPGRGRRDAAARRGARASRPRRRSSGMRLANEIAAAAMEHVREQLRPFMKESRGRRALAGLRPRRGHGLARQGRARAPVLARLGRQGDQDVHRDRRPARRRGRAGAVRDLGLRRRLLGRPHEEPRRRRAASRSTPSWSRR